mmetsp:Transcript_27943/g.26982  ORF Transcript_27943/g.26982 Transcript_27943/m.26982 type:complete len:144 (-) Transcript_27943:895-1326(-)
MYMESPFYPYQQALQMREYEREKKKHKLAETYTKIKEQFTEKLTETLSRLEKNQQNEQAEAILEALGISDEEDLTIPARRAGHRTLDKSGSKDIGEEKRKKRKYKQRRAAHNVTGVGKDMIFGQIYIMEKMGKLNPEIRKVID